MLTSVNKRPGTCGDVPARAGAASKGNRSLRATCKEGISASNILSVRLGVWIGPSRE